MNISSKNRWLIVSVSCVESLLGILMGMGLGFAMFAAFTIIGVLIQPRFHRLGRGLICFGSILLTFFAFDIGFFMVTERQPGTQITLGVIYVFLSIVLVIACDVAVLFEELRIRRSEKIVKIHSQAPAHAPVANG